MLKGGNLLVTLMQTLKRRSAVTGACVGVLTATCDVVFMTVPLGERLAVGFWMGVPMGWVSFLALNGPLQGNLRRAAILAPVAGVAANVVSVLIWRLI